MKLENAKDFHQMLAVMADRAAELGLAQTSLLLNAVRWPAEANTSPTDFAHELLYEDYMDGVRSLVEGAFSDLLREVESGGIEDADDYVDMYFYEAVDSHMANYGHQREVAALSSNFDARGRAHSEWDDLVGEAYRADVIDVRDRFLRNSSWATPEEWLEGQLEGDEDEAEEEDDE